MEKELKDKIVTVVKRPRFKVLDEMLLKNGKTLVLSKNNFNNYVIGQKIEVDGMEIFLKGSIILEKEEAKKLLNLLKKIE